MDSEATDLHLMKINELLQDEDKIVTFTSIASDFDIEVGDAKALLSQYVSDQRDLKPDTLAITYIIAGTLKDSNRLTVNLVKEENLPEKKNEFEKIASEFIYSVQKSKNVNFTTISSVNELNGAKTIVGALVGKNCVKGELKVKKIEIVPKDCKPIVSKNANSGSKPSLFSQCTEKPSTSKESVQNNQQPKQSQTKGKSTGGITSFFTKMPAKKEVNSFKKTEGEPKEKKEEAKPKDKEEEAKPKEEIEEAMPKGKKEERKSKDNKEEKYGGDAKREGTTGRKRSQVLEDEEMDVEDINETTPKKAEESKPTKKRKKGNKEQEQQNKKRKRIRQICDSDSDDNMFGENEENKLAEKSDDEEDAPTFIKAPLGPKNKIRKAVDVTYEDDEGFIITKTEYVYEDPPEDEVKIEEPVERAAVKPKVLEKKSSPNEAENGVKTKGKKNAKKPVTGKQPTLMSFFKKA